MSVKRGILLTTLMLFLWGCTKSEKNEVPQVQTKKEDAVIVRTAKVIKQTITVPLHVFGQGEALRQVDIFPKINGVVVEQKAKLGDRVQKDQVLALVRQDIPGMDFSLSKIKATISGFVTAENVEVGGTVNVQRAAFSLSQYTPILVTVPVLDTYLRYLHTGQTAEVIFDAIPGKIFSGKIHEIAPQVDAVSHSIKVRIQLNNPSNRIKPGMFARVKFNLSSHTGLLIPVDAVVRSGAEKYVFLVRDGKAVKRRIRTGLLTGDRIEVVEGLRQGETVVTLGQNYLDEGTPVRESSEG